MTPRLLRAVRGLRSMVVPGELEAVTAAPETEAASAVTELLALAERASVNPKIFLELGGACRSTLLEARMPLKASGRTHCLPLVRELEQSLDALAPSMGVNACAALAAVMTLLAEALKSHAPPPRARELLAIAGLRSLRGAPAPWDSSLVVFEAETLEPPDPLAESPRPHPGFIRRALAAYRKCLLKFLRGDAHEARRLAELSRRVKEVCGEDAERRRWGAAEALFSRADETGAAEYPLVKRMAVKLEQVLKRLSENLPSQAPDQRAMIADLGVINALLTASAGARDGEAPQELRLRLSERALKSATDGLTDSPGSAQARLAEIADAFLVDGRYEFWLEALELAGGTLDDEALRIAVARWIAPLPNDGELAPERAAGAGPGRARSALSRLGDGREAAAETAESPERIAGIAVDEALLENLNLMAQEIRGARSRAEANLGNLKGGLVDMERTIRVLRSQLESLEVESDAEGGEAWGAAVEHHAESKLSALSRGIEELAGLKDSLQALTDETESALAAQAGDDAQLEQGLLKTRMMPVGAQFESLCQGVRQAAAEQGIAATLRAHGAEVVLERSQMEALSRVLGPLLQACVQHGLDSADAGARTDPGDGQILLEVAQPRFDVTVEISYRGTPLSTAAMSAFAPALEALGAIAESTAGDDGVAWVRVLIPGPPQPMDLLLVEVGKSRYALPLKQICGVAKTPAAAGANGGERLIEVAGKPHRLTSLSQAIGLESAPADGGSLCVLVDGGGSPLACRVDGVIGRERMLVRSTGPLLAANPWVLGVVVDATAAPALVLDLGALRRGPTSSAR